MTDCPHCGRDDFDPGDLQRHLRGREKTGKCPARGRKRGPYKRKRGPKPKPPADPMTDGDYEYVRGNWT